MNQDSSQGHGPLHGMTVVECASVVAGPLTGQYLADMGADVIKVEAPTGDISRGAGPRRSEMMGSFFLGNNRNKRSMVLDLKRAEAREVLKTLVEKADVFLHSMRTSSAEKSGITYPTLSASNPGLVYCHIQGFSDDGVYGGRPAYDDIVQSLSGLAKLQTVVTGEPRYMPAIFADKVTAIHSAYAIAAALLFRERSGLGQEVKVPMFETMAAFNTVEHLWGYTFDPPVGPMGYEPVSTAARRPFATQDGFISLLPYSDSNWHRFFEIIGKPEIMTDSRFNTYAARQTNVKLVWAEISDRASEKTNAEWEDLLKDEDIPYAVVNSLEDLIDDPHLASVDFWKVVDDPNEGKLRFPSNPMTMSESEPEFRNIPPRLGADTEDVLIEAGMNHETIQAMRDRGVLGHIGQDS